MNILFFNNPSENVVVEYPDEAGESFLEIGDFGYFPPLGLLYILSYLEKHLPGHNLVLKDCPAEEITQDDIEQLVADLQPDIVAMTSYTISLLDIVISARAIRRAKPDVYICLGGHHPTAFPYQAAQLKEFDSIVVGEGEIAFTELVKALESGDDVNQIEGVYTETSIERWRKNSLRDNRFLHTVIAPPAYVEDIDSLPPPNREYIKNIDYHSVVGVSSKLATIISSRGCPYLCTFCDVPFKRYRQRSHKLVVDEMEACLELGYEEFHFYDDLFNIQPKKILGFCDEIDRRGLKVVWDFRGRVNGVNRESLERAKKSGLRMISFGVETGSNEGLKILKKGTKVTKILETFDLCHELGIVTVVDFMIGLPHERSRQDVIDNIKFAIGLDPDHIQFSILNLYPGTEIHAQAVSQGVAKQDHWEQYILDPQPGFAVEHWDEYLTVKEMVELHKYAYRRFYLRPRYILKSIFQTKSVHEFKVKAKGAFTIAGFNKIPGRSLGGLSWFKSEKEKAVVQSVE